jgi:hypothetical protein
VTLCGLVDNYCCLCLQDIFLYPENEGSRFLRTSGTSLLEYASYTVSRTGSGSIQRPSVSAAGELVVGFLFSDLINNLIS